MKKRRSKGLTNQSPDFNDDDDDRKEEINPTGPSPDSSNGAFGLGALFNIFKKKNNATTTHVGYGAGSEAGIHDLERQMNISGGKYYGAGDTGATLGTANRSNSGRNHQADDDFFYRGVTNSNNLDSVFRSSTTSGQTSIGKSGSGSASQRGGEITNTTASSALHSRFNSFAHPMPLALPDQFNFNEVDHEAEPLQSEKAAGYDSDPDSEYPSDLDIPGLPGAAVPMGHTAPYPHNLSLSSVGPVENVFANENDSNASRSRFTEEI